MEVDSAKEAFKDDPLEKRKQKFFDYLKKDKKWLIWSIFALIAWFGFWIRTRNIPLLKDVTTGDFIQADPDATAFLRYARHIVENGKLMDIDFMRYYPWGFENLIDFKLLSYAIAYLYKFLNFFDSSVTVGYAQVLYPPFAFVIGLIFFFLLVRKIFDYRIAIVSSLLLTIIPPYLFRTISGVGDKEALGMVFFFAALYFFVLGWKSEKLKKSLTFGVLSGLSTALMGLVWGGYAFLVSIIGLTGLISFVFLKFKREFFFTYCSWYVLFYLMMILFKNYHLNNIIGAYFGAVATASLFSGLFNFLILKYKLEKKIENKTKFPYKIFSLIFVIVLGIIFVTAWMGPNFLFSQLEQVYVTLTAPFGNDRWQLTVAEAHQPYLTDFINMVSWKF
ncbi:MAG: STT3 domain-containing protein, partial [Nanoarchaeota archaeon]